MPVSAGIELNALVFIEGAQTGDNAAGVGVGCDDVPFVAIVVEERGLIKDGQVTEFQVTLGIGFKLEDH